VRFEPRTRVRHRTWAVPPGPRTRPTLFAVAEVRLEPRTRVQLRTWAIQLGQVGPGWPPERSVWLVWAASLGGDRPGCDVDPVLGSEVAPGRPSVGPRSCTRDLSPVLGSSFAPGRFSWVRWATAGHPSGLSRLGVVQVRLEPRTRVRHHTWAIRLGQVSRLGPRGPRGPRGRRGRSGRKGPCRRGEGAGEAGGRPRTHGTGSGGGAGGDAARRGEGGESHTVLLAMTLELLAEGGEGCCRIHNPAFRLVHTDESTHQPSAVRPLAGLEFPDRTVAERWFGGVPVDDDGRRARRARIRPCAGSAGDLQHSRTRVEGGPRPMDVPR